MYYDIDIIYNITDAKDYMNFKKPYVIRGGCKKMKIFDDKDKMSYFKDSMKEILFPVEIYDNDNAMGETNVKKRRNIVFEKLYEKMQNNNNIDKQYYLAEVDLLDYETELPHDFFKKIEIEADEPRLNDGILIFLGKNGKSGCHLHTGHDYILNQIIGTKTVYMFDYYDNNMQFHGLFSDRSNFTKENFFTMDKSKMKIYKAVLEEGNSLMIPPWWWHAVEGHGVNLSITKTYDRSDHIYLFDKPYLMLVILVGGLYGMLEEYFIIIVSILLILLIFYIYVLTHDLTCRFTRVL